jgi:hypothetical protein
MGLMTACNPLIDGCVSISRAGRYDLPNYTFRALLLSAAVLQAFTWLLCRTWLVSLGARPRVRLSWLPWLGLAAAISLVLYGTFLGTDGLAYRWLRQYGTLVYFSCTYLCLLIAAGEISRLSGTVQALGQWHLDRTLVALCALMLLMGLTSVIVAHYFDDTIKDRIENVAEWWIGSAFTLCFGVIAFLWRRTEFVLRANTLRD